MCGIAGIVNLAAAPPPGEVLMRRMLSQLRHRGPDQFGIYVDRDVALGNARLSIIDLAGGQQPISNEDGTLWIVYNGEVFNHPELRVELESRGHRLVTCTDTEVIIHLFEEYGPECLSRLNGQFAFALWDSNRRSLFLARDRLGIRPLFYTQASGRLLFASEIKALFADPAVSRELDPAGVGQAFNFWAPMAPQTSFMGVRELPAGCYLEIQDTTPRLQSYWSLEFNPAPNANADEVIEAFRELLVDSTRIRLRADVPVGAYLSGGLDSAVIASVVKRLGVSQLDTFSISFSDPQFDESEHQLRMAEYLGTEHQVVHATCADIGRVFPEVVWHVETPLMRTAPAPMFLLSQLVRGRGYKVVLTGEGADEFLGGYDIFKEAMIRQFWARQPESRIRPRLLGQIYPDITRLAAMGPAYLEAFFGTGLRETEAPDYSHQVRWRNNRRTFRLFSEDFRSDAEPATSDPCKRFAQGFSTWGLLERAQYLEASIFMTGYLLAAQGDRVAMAHSVEGRYPFLDHRLVELCTRLPSKFKLRGLREKWLLRQVAKDWLPESIGNRRKRPYRAPIHYSFRDGPETGYVRDLLSPGTIQSVGVFKPKAVEHMSAKLHAGKPLGETDDMALVGVLSTQLLHRRFISDFHPLDALDEKDDIKVVDRSTLQSPHGVRRPARSFGASEQGPHGAINQNRK
ncbi:MAG: asparagine synthase (glutamine-hydrolyzing) [Verrucomicrobia bacterium]|nr:asparagine synthase (glutamine-hydrolyzing) [Verrucomicrobiota bacterium]